ncbi:TrkA family potassium uptake protein [Arcanobacterium phocisimile]|uniref:TrkA family potassium uptake protein n=1 Tax=Arcanobacterium phocisimile TaxID=1302235 RepID=A0ABX7IGZ9_9ACTO|nr:TrkA family potassium uptake protein [Arcanobacterium phocisimile]QRV02025.1 TrkA family potassium uptake protein [Arcanobacterium phocisimile]
MRLRHSAHKHDVAVFGLGRFGSALALELVYAGYSVLGIDKSPAVVQSLANKLPHVVATDPTNEETLHELGIQDFSRVVVAIGNDLASSILVTSALLKMNGPEVWAKASTPQQGQILEQMGVTHIFYPESDMGRRAAHIVAQSFNDYVELGYGYALVSTTVNQEMTGKPLAELGLRRSKGISVIAVKGPNDHWINAYAETVLEPGDEILAVGPTKTIASIVAE